MMDKTVDVDPIELVKILKELFPHILFFPSSSGKGLSDLLEKADICDLIRGNKEIYYNEKETLIWAMMKNEKFSDLFPKDALQDWEDLANKIKAGGCQIINYFINKIDERFIHGLNTVVHEEIKPKDSVVERFNDDFLKDMDKKPRTFSLDKFRKPKLMNICEHLPSSFYKAFEYYAHKQYTLIRLGMEFPVEDLHKKWKFDLEEKLKDKDERNNYLGLEYFYIGFIKNYENTYTVIKKKDSTIAFALDIISELFVKNLIIRNEETQIVKQSIPFMRNVMIMINEILESTPRSYRTTPYVPTDFITLTGQISGQIGHVEKYDPDEDYIDDSDGIQFSQIGRENNEVDENHEFFTPNDNKPFKIDKILKKFIVYEDVYKDRAKFAEFIRQLFKEEDEKDFIDFVEKKGEWSKIMNELSSYYNKKPGKHISGLLFKTYKGKRKLAVHKPFEVKIVKAINMYKKWYEGTDSQEAKHGKRT
jgi:hypothetical protein